MAGTDTLPACLANPGSAPTQLARTLPPSIHSETRTKDAAVKPDFISLPSAEAEGLGQGMLQYSPLLDEIMFEPLPLTDIPKQDAA